MKFASIHPEESRYAFADADTITAFAISNNMRLHGHTRVWYESVPAWLRQFNGDSARWEQLLKTHISTVLSHYKGKLASFDVVNEVFLDKGVLGKEDTDTSRYDN
jgi:endo-1,4-beta-xylanase